MKAEEIIIIENKTKTKTKRRNFGHDKSTSIHEFMWAYHDMICEQKIAPEIIKQSDCDKGVDALLGALEESVPQAGMVGLDDAASSKLLNLLNGF